MKTINLNEESPSLGEILAMARKKSVLLVSQEGVSFVLEEADEFDREVAELGNSARFMRFLRRRSREHATTSIEELAAELTGTRPAAAKSRRTPPHSRTRSVRKR
jgi:hypothetical protein